MLLRNRLSRSHFGRPTSVEFLWICLYCRKTLIKNSDRSIKHCLYYYSFDPISKRDIELDACCSFHVYFTTYSHNSLGKYTTCFSSRPVLARVHYLIWNRHKPMGVGVGKTLVHNSPKNCTTIFTMIVTVQFT